jgi:hypothetical protein
VPFLDRLARIASGWKAPRAQLPLARSSRSNSTPKAKSSVPACPTATGSGNDRSRLSSYQGSLTGKVRTTGTRKRNTALAGNLGREIQIPEIERLVAPEATPKRVRPEELELKDRWIRLILVPFFGIIIPNLTGLFGPLGPRSFVYWASYLYFILIPGWFGKGTASSCSSSDNILTGLITPFGKSSFCSLSTSFTRLLWPWGCWWAGPTWLGSPIGRPFG